MAGRLGQLCRYPAIFDSMKKRQSISFKYVFVMMGMACLHLATYPACQVYSLIGLSFFLLFCLSFVRRLSWLAAIGVVSFALIWTATFGYVLFHGPVTRNYNNRLAQIVYTNQLIGERIDAAVELLGPPTSRFESENGETFNYAPFRFFPNGEFQLHCSRERIRSLELFDDWESAGWQKKMYRSREAGRNRMDNHLSQPGDFRRFPSK